MQFIGEIAALITALLWSGSSIVFTEASRRIGSQQLNVNRLIAALCFLFIINLFIGIDDKISNQQYFYLIISGIIGLVFGDGFLFKAFQTIGARYSMLLMSLVPAFTALLAFFFLNEVLSFTALIGMAITITGIVIVVSDKKNNPKEVMTLPGLLFGIFGAVGQAAGLLFAKSAFMLGEINGFTATFIRISASVILFVPVMIIFKQYSNPVKVYSNDIKSLWLTITGSIIGPVLGITFSLIAIKYTDVGIASTLMSTVPVTMLPLVWLVYKEKISFFSFLGSIVAVIGVAVLILR